MTLFRLNLHMFEGEGAAAGAADAGQGEQAALPELPGKARRGKSGEFDNVLFGSEADREGAQAAAEQEPEVQVTSKPLEERRKAFRDLVNGEYRDVYTEETQRIIDRRFAETRNLQKQLDDAKPILDKLAARYDILDGDMSKLAKAIDDDDSYWSAAAEESGMPVQQYKEYQRMRQQNAMLLQEQKNRMAQAQANAQMQRWFQESQAVKAKYPDFDFNSELNNPTFVSLLRAGTPIEHAYKVMHFDALMGDAVQATAANTEQAVVKNIQAKGNRPTENGTASQSAFTVKKDVSALSRKERAEIARRVEHGAKISF